MQRFEYVTINEEHSLIGGSINYFLPNGEKKKYSNTDIEGKNINALLNAFGKEGFELVEATTNATNVGVYFRIWVMKRPIP